MVARRAGGAEDSHRGPDFVERVKPLDELGQDAQDAPRVGVVAELLDRAALEQRPVGRGLLGRDDKATGAAAVGDLPPSRVVHQVSGLNSSRGGNSVAPSVGIATGSVSDVGDNEIRLRAFLADLSSPLPLEAVSAEMVSGGCLVAVWSGISRSPSRCARRDVTSASSSWTRRRWRMCSVKWWRPLNQWKRVPVTSTNARGTRATVHRGTPSMRKTENPIATGAVLL